MPPLRLAALVRAPALGALTLCAAAFCAMLPAAAQAPRPMEVTSDSAAYCQHLASRIMALRQRLPGPAPEIDFLLDRGQRLCAAGRVRPGLSRLRHALLDLHEGRRGE